MINVSIRPCEVKITGHANSDEYGKDLVCCAVSILVQGLVASFEALTTDDINYDMDDGNFRLNYKENLSEVGKTLIDSFFVGICMISDNYPDNVRVI